MGGAWARLGVLACALLAAGCFLHADRPGAQQVVRTLAPPVRTEGVVLDHVLVEQPIGDAFLDRELWAGALPAGRPETRALLAENGLRAAVLAGGIPQKLQTLLDSEADTVSPRRLTFQQRKELVVATSVPRDPCRFFLLTDLGAEARPVELKQARCGVLVRPEPTSDGRVKVWCEPQVQHGTRRELYLPNEDGTQLVKEEEVPTEKYPALGFEAVLGPEDYLLIGWPAGESETLGAAAFTADANGRPRQRVLVVRAHHATPERPAELPHIRDPYNRPSVAEQAASSECGVQP